VPRLCQLYPGICLTTEEKARENLSYGSSTYNTSRHSTIQADTVQYKQTQYNTSRHSKYKQTVQYKQTQYNTRMYMNRISGCPSMCLVLVSPRVITFVCKLSLSLSRSQICSPVCSRHASEWTMKCEGKASRLGWHVGKWDSVICVAVYGGVAGCLGQPRVHRSITMTTLLAIHTAAVATAWSLLGSSREGLQPFTYFNIIYCVENTLLTSVEADIFETDRRRVMERAQCCPRRNAPSSERKPSASTLLGSSSTLLLTVDAVHILGVSKSSVNGTRKQTKQKIQTN
jgi:hypothetical protein